MSRALGTIKDKEKVAALVREAIDVVMEYLVEDNILYSYYSVAIPAKDLGDDKWYTVVFYLHRYSSGLGGNSATEEYVCWSPGMLDDTWIVDSKPNGFTIKRTEYIGLFSIKKKAQVTKFNYRRTNPPKINRCLCKRYLDTETAVKTREGYYIAFGTPEDVL